MLVACRAAAFCLPGFSLENREWRLKNDSSQANCFSQKIDIKIDSAYFFSGIVKMCT